MTLNLPHKPHGLTRAKNLSDDSDQRTELMLREIAFVLKMTEKVRAEIEADKEIAELAMA